MHPSAKIVKYLPYSKVGQDNLAAIRRQLSKLYEEAGNSIANGIAIENGSMVFIVDSGKEDGTIRFGVRGKIKISDGEFRAEYIRRANDEAVSNGYISDGLSTRLGDRYDHDWEGNLRRESGTELSNDQGKLQDHQRGVFERNGDRGNRGLTSSHKVTGEVVTLSEGQYADFGWVRVNDILTQGEWKDFTSKFADAVTKKTNPPKTKNGEYMIAVSDIDDALRYGTDNIIVYAKGSIESPQVSRVLEIDLDNETDLDRERRKIYVTARRGLQPPSGGVFRFYASTDFGRGLYEQGKRHQEWQNNGQLGADRGGGRKTTDRIKEFKVNEDGSFTTIYTDGRVETERPKVKRSRKATGETVTLSRGELAKLHANYAKDANGEAVDRRRGAQYKDLYTSTDEFIGEVAERDRHAFARSLANKTSGLADGERKTVEIYLVKIFIGLRPMDICTAKCYSLLIPMILMVVSVQERILKMELTLIQKLLIYGLTLFPLDEMERKAIFHILKTEDEMEQLILFLRLNEKATAQEIKEEVTRIIELTGKKLTE